MAIRKCARLSCLFRCHRPAVFPSGPMRFRASDLGIAGPKSLPRLIAVLMISALWAPSWLVAAEPVDNARAKCRSQYEALVNEYDTSWKAYTEVLTKATTDAARATAMGIRPLPQNLAERFFALAERYPNDPVAIDALTWIASHCMFTAEGKKALRILAREYSSNDQLADYIGVPFRYGEPFEAHEELLRAVLKNNPSPDIQVSACAALAVYLKMAKERSEMNLVRISLFKGRQFMIPETSWNLDRLVERGLENIATESEALFERLVKEYENVTLKNYFPHEAGAFAKQQLFELKNLPRQWNSWVNFG